MACPRCRDPERELAQGADWCELCEEEYDVYIRAHATGIIAPVLTAMVIISVGGLLVPLLGGSTLIAALGVFAGFGTMVGMVRHNRRRLRRRFLRAPLPQARLTSG